MSKSKNRVAELVKKIRHINDEADKKGADGAKYITDRCNTIAKEEHKRLGVVVDSKTGEMLSEPKVSYRYYAKLMNGYRDAIQALGLKHHNIEKHIKAFKNKFSGAIEGLDDLLDENLPIEELRDNLIILRSRTKQGSEIREEIKKLKIEHHAFYTFSTKATVKDWISDDNEKKLEKKLNSQTRVNPEWLKNLCESLLLKDEPSIQELFVGISLATGRRLTEVMKTAVFKELDESSLLFSGQLKTKNRHLFEDIAAYEIPSLVNAGLVVKALKNLRKETGKDQLKYKDQLGEDVFSTVDGSDMKDYLHNAAVQQKYKNMMNKAVHVLLGESRLDAKDCRALYTEMTYEDHHNEGESRPAYRRRVCGHSMIETQLHYDSFKIDSSVDTIQVKREEEAPEDIKEALLAHLSAQDITVNNYLRAPKMAIMHQWLKDQIAGGLPHDQVTGAFIRKHCLFEGKQVNLNTAKKYLTEFAKWDEFTPPEPKKKEPESEAEQKLRELQQELENTQERLDEIDSERGELEREKADIEERLEDIDSEDEDLEEEQEELTGKLDDLTRLVEEAEAEFEAEKNGDVIVWPPVEKLAIKAKKQGTGYLVSAVVEDQIIEQWSAGAKTSAIASFKAYYKREYMKNN